jgi:hypothetical protein
MRRHTDNSRSADQKENDNNETPGSATEPQQATGCSGSALQHYEKLR